MSAMDGARQVGAVAADALAVTFFVALLYVLVRPQSKAAEAVRLFFNAIVAMVKTATDL